MKPTKDYYEGLEERLLGLVAEHSNWAQTTFGDDFERGPLSPLHHLKKEVEEVIADPYKRDEYADCFMLLIDAYRRAGGNIYDLIAATEEKLEVCKNRKWGKPDENGVCEHVE